MIDYIEHKLEQKQIHDNIAKGHTDHCAKRLTFGDGECECQLGCRILLGEHVVSSLCDDVVKLCENFKFNVANTPLKKAREFATFELKKVSKDLDTEIPDFDKNYLVLQKNTKNSPAIPRVQMPVIEPTDMKRFQKDLAKGHLDIFKPFVRKSEFFPKNLRPNKQGRKFLTLGIKDGDDKDDVVKAELKSISAINLKPTQNQIWLENLMGPITKFGAPKAGSPILKTTVIVSEDGFILDGHHRYGQVMLINPQLKMSTLFVPLNIKLLLKIGRSYGNAIGNTQKQ